MFKVIRIDKLLRYSAWITMALSVGIYFIIQLWNDTITLFKLITIGSIVSATIVFVLVSNPVSRWLWGVCRRISPQMYPDLNGTWEGSVTTEEGLTIPVRCIIRQRLLDTEIDMHGKTMKSTTLESTPVISNGQKKLYYTYRSIPKTVAYGDYYGSTLFDIRETNNDGDKTLELSGKYYTDRKTIGRIVLKQTGKDINQDVSFY